MPSDEIVDTNAIGRGITDVVKILYMSLIPRMTISHELEQISQLKKRNKLRCACLWDPSLPTFAFSSVPFFCKRTIFWDTLSDVPLWAWGLRELETVGRVELGQR